MALKQPTERQMLAIKLAATGKPRKQVAFKMGITVKAFDDLLHRLYKHWNVDGVVNAIRTAIERGVLPVDWYKQQEK